MTLEAYPLTWPAGQPRLPGHRRTDAAFKVQIGRTRDELLAELRLLGATGVVISSNLPVRRDGIPYADAREPGDPGVAVYFDRRVNGERRPFVIACDSYRKLVWNMRAIGMTVEALRTIARHGANSMLEQAFTGFAALPPAQQAKSWWETLGVSRDATVTQAREAWCALSLVHHPDVGGSHDRMSEINAAFDRAKAEARRDA
jgi:hypothetical protein